ncbi:MAG: cysteine--tRNA ligase [Candidatus Spechtbacterales bacterium]
MKLYDTLSGKKKMLRKTKDTINLYVCGPTVYDYAHIGHARTYVVFDMLVKYLRARGHKVFYLQNITDVEDKILNRAREEQKEPKDVARFYENTYHEDMKALGVTSVDKHARASDYIKEIIKQIELLVEKEYAYQTDNGVYFRVRKFPRYGALSHQKLSELRTGVNIEEDALKEDPLDFVLWKAAKPGEPTWKSPWGEGRPGWHIEDTALAQKEFGSPKYELHGGARDLIFPHHEAEIAQMEAAYGVHPMVKTWLHTGFLQIRGEKMAKSLKNFITIRKILETYSVQTLRVLFTTRHYRSPIEYSEIQLSEAQAVERRIGEFWSRLRNVKPKLKTDRQYPKFIAAFWKELEDDFNTPAAFAHLFTLISYVNPKITAGALAARDARAMMEFLKEVNAIFGVVDEHRLAEPEQLPSQVVHLLREREALRADKKWNQADLLRQEIEELGYELNDTDSGTSIKRKPRQ